MDGFFLINKPVGWTSFDTCAYIRKKFGIKRVGHTGTLDPFANGLMIIAVNKATKLIPFLENEDKKYIATLTLGSDTDTLDCTGKIINEKEITPFSQNQVKECFNKFVGENEQIPPMYSALKSNGIPLYALAREGVDIKRKPRKIHIYEMELLSLNEKEITFYSHVSKGTYIRVLANDIAHSLSNCGYLSSLQRISIGKQNIDKAKDIKSIEERDLIPIADFLSFIKVIEIEDDNLLKRVKNGNEIIFEGEDIILFVDMEHNPLAIYTRIEGNIYRCKRGL